MFFLKRSLITSSILLILLALLLQAPAFSEESETDLNRQIEAKHTELVETAIQLFARYGMDDVSVYQTDNVVDRNSGAWDHLASFDKGWFTKTKSRKFSNIRTENWKYVSETEFCVDAFCDFTISYTYADKIETFPCAYHFCFHQTNAKKDLWEIYDFEYIPNEADALIAERFTAENEGISMYAVSGKSFSGFMTVIDDPSRVFVGSIDRYTKNSTGLRINQLVEKYEVLGGINGGAFSDPGGSGTGGMANGLVISEGEQRKAHSPGGNNTKVVIGFDVNDKLVVGSYTANEIAGLNRRDALAFNKALVIDGKKPQETLGSNYTVRTAIGQDAQGRVLMLVAKGRQPDCLGANFDDLAEIMLEFGAVTAGNLDGGTSTCLYLNGESVYSGYRLDVSRRLPTGFLIKKADSGAE